MDNIPSFYIPQPAMAHRFGVNFLNKEINEALTPSLNGVDVDFIKRKATLRFDLSITDTQFCKQLNTILEGLRRKHTISKNVYDFSEKILVEYLNGNGGLWGGLLLESVRILEDGLQISHYYGNSGVQPFDIKCTFDRAVFLSNEMLRNRGLISE